MSLLLGIELREAKAVLTSVERGGRVLSSLTEPLDGPVCEWWRTHADERYRAVLALLERAASEGCFVGGGVAGIGLTAESGLVLLDRELVPIPPHVFPWREIVEIAPTPMAALRAWLRDDPRRGRRIGVVFSILDYLRFRMTGAIATHRAWAWESALVSGPLALGNWDGNAIDESGIPPGALPPIFAATCRVGVVSEEIVDRTGIQRGVWVNAGSDPRSAALFAAAEPVDGTRILLLSRGRAELWRVGPPPTDRQRSTIPSPLEGGRWYHLEDAYPRETGDLPIERGGSVPREWFDAARLVLDFRDRGDVAGWPETLASPVSVAYDAGGASAAAAIQMGLGLGWWRDPRPLWRKRRPPAPYTDWIRGRLASAEVGGKPGLPGTTLDRPRSEADGVAPRAAGKRSNPGSDDE